jgi:hypothetical protein
MTLMDAGGEMFCCAFIYLNNPRGQFDAVPTANDDGLIRGDVLEESLITLRKSPRRLGRHRAQGNR